MRNSYRICIEMKRVCWWSVASHCRSCDFCLFVCAAAQVQTLSSLECQTFLGEHSFAPLFLSLSLFTGLSRQFRLSLHALGIKSHAPTNNSETKSHIQTKTNEIKMDGLLNKFLLFWIGTHRTKRRPPSDPASAKSFRKIKFSSHGQP